MDHLFITGIIHYYWSDVLGNPISGWYISTTDGIYWCNNALDDNHNAWLKYADGNISGISSRYGRAMAATADGKILTSSGASEWVDCTPTNISITYPVFTSLCCDGTSFYVIGSGLLKAT